MNSVTLLHGPIEGPEVLAFGPWRLDRRAGELHRRSERVPLQEQPFRVLELLVLRTGEVVTREELIAHVWPRGTVIDFDTGLNTAVRKLRQLFDDDPDAPRFIQTLPRRGYRFIRQPEEPAIPPPAPSVASIPEAPPPRPPRRVPLGWSAAVAVLVLGVGAAVLWQQQREAPPPPDAAVEALPRNSIAVLPFRRLGSDAGDDALALGLAESVLHQLSTSPDLRVIARTSSFSFREQEADFPKVGRALGARYLLDGTLQTRDGQLRLTTRLIDASNDRTLWSLRFDRRLADVFALQDEIALQVARILRVSLAGSGLHVGEAQGTGDVDAYFDYLQGRNLTVSRRVADLREAERHLVEATRRDPQFAAALAELARARELLLTYDPPATPAEKMRRYDEAREAARRALELTPDSPAALVAVGTMTDDVPAALGYFRRAIAINPNFALAWQQMAELLVGGNVADDPQTLPVIDSALRLDPLDPRLQYLKGLYHFLKRGDAATAAEQFRSTIEANPEYYVALARLAQMEACCLGQPAEAVRHAEQALRLDPQARWVRRLLVSLYLDLGDIAAAEDVARGAPTPDAGSLLLIDLRHGRKAEAVRRLADPANASNWMSFETSEGAFLGRLALIDPANTAALKVSVKLAEEQILPPAGVERPVPDIVLAHVNHAALLQHQGRKKDAAGGLERALTLSATQSGLMQRLPELRAVALSLDERRDEAIGQLEGGHAGLWSYWWYYADIEPALEPLRADTRFIAWRSRMEQQARQERERLRAMRVAGVVPPRDGSPAG